MAQITEHPVPDQEVDLSRVLLGSTVSGWMGWLGFLCSIGEKLFLVGLVDQPFQPASNRVEMVEKAFA